MDRREGLAVALVRQMFVRMWSGDDGQVASEGGLDFLVEVVGVVVRQEDEVDVGKIVQVDGWIRYPCSSNPGTQVDVVSLVQEVGVRHQPKTLPFEDRGGRADEEEACIVLRGLGRMGFG